MKIGVTLSGCDMGGVAAYQVLRDIEEQGLDIGMVSCCGLSAVGALLYACQYTQETCAQVAGKLLQDTRQVDLDFAVAEFAARIQVPGMESPTPIVVSSVNVPDGKIHAFSQGVSPASGAVAAHSLAETYDALSATISPAGGLSSYRYEDCRLCDFSVWYGLPVYPLKMAGCEKIISVSFLPQCPVTPYEVMAKQRISTSAHQADLHLAIAFGREEQTLEEYLDVTAQRTKSFVEAVCMKALF